MTPKTTTVLVTGGTGFVGSAVVAALQSAGAKVTVLSRAPRLPPGLSCAAHARADLTTLTPDSAAALLEGVDVVVHCAGEISNVQAMAEVNEHATGTLARAASGRVTHWVQLSSVGALGHDVVGTITPTTPGKPAGAYEVSKKRGDDVVRAALAGSGTTLSVLMPTIVFGPGMRSRALHRLFTAVASNRFAHVGPLDTPAHYVFVDDVAHAVVSAVQERPEGTFLVQDPSTVGEFIDEVARLVGVAAPRRRVPEVIVRAVLSPRLMHLPVPGRSALLALRSRTRYAADGPGLAWRPSIGWREGLAITYASWKPDRGSDLHIVYLTTIPATLNFFRGHMLHERALGSRLTVMSSSADGELAAFADEVGATAAPVEMSRVIAPAADLRSLRRLVRLMSETRPDVVQIATPKASLLGAFAARLAKAPVVVVGVFGLPQMTEAGWRRWLLDTATRISTWSAHVVWCDSASMADYVVAQRLAPHGRVLVVGNGSVGGVDATGTFDPERAISDGRATRAALGIPPEAPVVGFVGRLARDKGMLELGRAWQSLRERHPELHLLLVGPDDGDLSPEAQHLLVADSRTHVVGAQRSVAPYFAAMDLFVMPTYREGFCMTNLEASAMGLPVVATKIPGCVDSVTDGRTGTLVPPRDASALVAAIEGYLSSPELAVRHGTAGRARALTDFGPAAIQAELSQIYRDRMGRP